MMKKKRKYTNSFFYLKDELISFKFYICTDFESVYNKERQKMKTQIFVSAVTANSGKTLFAMGLSRALKKLGMKVQPFKCGPDFLDAQLLSVVSDYETVNLDLWMANPTRLQHLYNKYGDLADVCITEGVGGLYDGYKRMQGSSAEIASFLHVPVVLLINARVAGYSVAPVIAGFKNFYSGIQIAGVVFNQVSSVNHYMHLREACSDVNVDCFGYIPVIDSFKMPSKHSVMSLANKRMMEEQLDGIADLLLKTIDVNRLLSKCNRAFPCQYTLPYYSDLDSDSWVVVGHKMKIAIARDSAFNFTYRENIDRLKEMGNITYFSPLFSNGLPEADLIYLPGGYVELFARQLYRRRKMMDALKDYAESGGKILAESGGMLLLGRTLQSRENGTAYSMSNILPIDFTVPFVLKPNLGYRKISFSEKELRGYEYRYSAIQKDDTKDEIWDFVTNLKGTERKLPLYRYKNVIASYVHWYWGDYNILNLWK